MKKILIALIISISSCTKPAEFVSNATYTLTSIDSIEQTAVFKDSKGNENLYSIENCTFVSKDVSGAVVGESYFSVIWFEPAGQSHVMMLSSSKIKL